MPLQRLGCKRQHLLWGYTLVIPAFRGLSQEGYGFKASLGYKVSQVCVTPPQNNSGRRQKLSSHLACVLRLLAARMSDPISGEDSVGRNSRSFQPIASRVGFFIFLWVMGRNLMLWPQSSLQISKASQKTDMDQGHLAGPFLDPWPSKTV